jgi:cell division protein FtsN
VTVPTTATFHPHLFHRTNPKADQLMAMQFKRPQRGGTVLGFIVGVLVGLAGALGVAVYVTKVPVPFVDRVISRKASEDVAEAERNKNWNPNAALGGKPAKLATPPEGEAPAADAAPTEDKPAKKGKDGKEGKEGKVTDAPKSEAETPVPAPAKEAKADAPKGKTYSSDPLGDMVQSKAQGKSVATAPADAKALAAATAEPFTYFVQVGAFRTPEDAQAQRAKLALMGLDAKVSEREQAGRTVYLVRLGPYEHLTDAERMKDNLSPSGLDTALVRVQR